MLNLSASSEEPELPPNEDGGDVEGVTEQPDLDDSYLIDLFDEVYFDTLQPVFDAMLPHVQNLSLRRRVVQDNLRFLLMELGLLRCIGKEYLAYFRGDGTWAKSCSFYHANGASSFMVRIVDELIRLGFLENSIGYQNRAYGGRGSRYSRIRPIGELADLLSHHHVVCESLHRQAEWPLVFVKNKDGANAKLKGTSYRRFVDDQTNFIETYNELIGTVSTTHKQCLTYLQKHKHMEIYRVFNRSSLECGGRFYGGWWESIKKKQRPYITIGGEETVELDYSAQHPHFLYGYYAGINYQHDTEPATPKDFYQFGDIPREVGKMMILPLISCENQKGGYGAIRKKMMEKVKELEDEETPNPEAITFWKMWYEECRRDERIDKLLLENFHFRHLPILPLLCTDKGPHLMRLDSLVAEYVLREMTSRGVPTLSVHDSFIVTKPHAPVLYQVMRDAYLNQEWKGKPLALSLPPIKLKQGDEPSVTYLGTPLDT
ncbi:MAG: hypothetical protein WAZ18_03255 [Alphaproteobacteria bacterium]